MRFVVSASREPTSLLPSLRSAIGEIEKDAPIYNEGTMEGWLGNSLSSARFSTSLLFGFAVLALVLAATGLYGVMAYFVVERTREIGIRVAVGAGPAHITKWILTKGAVMAGIGAIAGLFVAVGFSRFISDLLFSTSPVDAITYVSVLMILTVTGFFACLIPARRALRTDPTDAMRG